MKEFHVRITIRNNCLLRRMRQHGCPSIRSLAEASGASLGDCYAMSHLKLHPIKKDLGGTPTGEYRRVFVVLANFFGCHESELWPETLDDAVQSNCFEHEIDAEQMRMLGGPNALRIDHTPEKAAAQVMARDSLAAAMQALRPRERDVVNRRMRGEGLDEIGRQLDVTRERVRQLEKRAYQRLRHPRHHLRGVWEEAA